MDKTYCLTLTIGGDDFKDIPFYADSDADAKKVGETYFKKVSESASLVRVRVTDLVIGFFDGVSFSTGINLLIYDSGKV